MSFFWATAVADSNDRCDKRESDVNKRKKSSRRKTKGKNKSEAATQTATKDVEAAARTQYVRLGSHLKICGRYCHDVQ